MKMCKEHIVSPLNNVDGPKWPIGTSENCKKKKINLLTIIGSHFNFFKKFFLSH